MNLAGMGDGDRVELVTADGLTYVIEYHGEQAVGDDGRPAPGFTVGYYTLRLPDGRTQSFRHSPYKPNSWASLAKSAAADQVLDAVRRARPVREE